MVGNELFNVLTSGALMITVTAIFAIATILIFVGVVEITRRLKKSLHNYIVNRKAVSRR